MQLSIKKESSLQQQQQQKRKKRCSHYNIHLEIVSSSHSLVDAFLVLVTLWRRRRSAKQTHKKTNSTLKAKRRKGNEKLKERTQCTHTVRSCVFECEHTSSFFSLFIMNCNTNIERRYPLLDIVGIAEMMFMHSSASSHTC